jgi:hypothetical protein
VLAISGFNVGIVTGFFFFIARALEQLICPRIEAAAVAHGEGCEDRGVGRAGCLDGPFEITAKPVDRAATTGCGEDCPSQLEGYSLEPFHPLP